MKKIISSILIVTAVLIAGAGCKKKDNNSADTAQLYFHIHTNIDTNEVENYNQVYETGAGRKISLSKAQLYVSHIQLVKQDGSTYEIPDTVVLKVFEQEVYFVANVPTGIYKSVKFNVGLDATQNTASSSTADVFNHPEMWYGSTTQPGGYVFANVQGAIDTTTNGNGTMAQMQPFVYKLGTSANYKQVSMPDHTPAYNFEKDQVQYIHLIADYSQLFNGIQLNNSANLNIRSVAANSTTNGAAVGNNISAMFSYEE